MKKFKIKSFCKINLSLRVLSRLNNGYHKINSIITFCNLHDLISISKTQKKDVITFSGKFYKKINKKKNTINQLLFILRKRSLLKNNFFKINIKKNIPHGSGLGGGSSNAASLLNFLNAEMNLKLNKNELYKIARRIGFDVPISLKKKNTLITGRKNEIIRINRKFGLSILVVYPKIICSTSEIYKKNKIIKFSKFKSNLKKLNRKKMINFLKSENNDLQKAVIKLYPKVQKTLDFIKIQNGCYFSRITGSGSSCIGIFSNMKTAVFAQKLIKLKFPKYWCAVSKSI